MFAGYRCSWSPTHHRLGKVSDFFLVLEMSKEFARMPGIIAKLASVYVRGYKYGLRGFVRTKRNP